MGRLNIICLTSLLFSNLLKLLKALFFMNCHFYPIRTRVSPRELFYPTHSSSLYSALLQIPPYHSICVGKSTQTDIFFVKGCPSHPLYVVISTDAIGYLLEVAKLHKQIRAITLLDVEWLFMCILHMIPLSS